ncbi:RHTO0S21e01354g4_1 [Rhodotorula toruloides]|uniref:RHTO0S21e01354g4_1 n=1 Tax=Rhodotorula toruloides TaxID=5286 RepID=A0A061BLR3_RHOTO|nr:RHTO0S21e01354g4_1 [Rhodotorula toruloides]
MSRRSIGDGVLTTEATRQSSLRNLNLEQGEGTGVSLPPTDRGRGAWEFALAAFILETFIWGYSYSFATILVYLQSTPPWSSSSLSALSAIGSCQIGIQFCLSPFVVIVFRRYPDWVKASLWVSLVVSCGSMLLSSWATKVWQLIALQGIICGATGAILYTPVWIWLIEWFVERRGLAGGIIWSGTGIGGFVRLRLDGPRLGPHHGRRLRVRRLHRQTSHPAAKGQEGRAWSLAGFPLEGLDRSDLRGHGSCLSFRLTLDLPRIALPRYLRLVAHHFGLCGGDRRGDIQYRRISRLHRVRLRLGLVVHGRDDLVWRPRDSHCAIRVGMGGHAGEDIRFRGLVWLFLADDRCVVRRYPRRSRSRPLRRSARLLPPLGRPRRRVNGHAARLAKAV